MKSPTESTKLEPYNLRPSFVKDLHELVGRNHDALLVDFPTVPERYRTIIDTVRSVRRANNNPDVDAFGIVYEAGVERISEGQATFMENLCGDPDSYGTVWVTRKPKLVGVATLVAEDDEENAAYGAWWIDRERRKASLGDSAAALLIEAAREKGLGKLNAYIRPSNVSSVSIAKKHGFEADGTPGVVDLGDQVTSKRQRFTLELR